MIFNGVVATGTNLLGSFTPAISFFPLIISAIVCSSHI